MKAPAPATLPALTGIRFFAAAWVVAYHFRSDLKTLFPASKPAWPLLDAGYAGVDIFFVLSGFIISHVYLQTFRQVRAGGYTRFMWLRFARIWPVHILTLLVLYVAGFPGTLRDLPLGDLADGLSGSDFWRQVFMVHAWGTDGNIAWNYPAWSISDEWFAYLLFPFAALWLARSHRRSVLLTGLAGCLTFNVATFLLLDWTGYHGRILLLRIVGEFGAGCFAYLLWRDGWLRDANWPLVTWVSAAIGAVATVLIATGSDIAPVLAAPAYVALVVALANGTGGLAAFLSRPLVVFGGEASYALYMTHAVSQRFVWQRWPAANLTDNSRLDRAAFLLGEVALILVVAVATYLLVERPTRNWLRWLAARVQDRASARRAQEAPVYSSAGDPTANPPLP